MTSSVPPPLLVPVDEVAYRAGLDPADPRVAAVVEIAIRDATADVEAYLGRPTQPLAITESGLRPSWDGTWPLSVDPLVHLGLVTAEVDTAGQPTGLYTVAYVAGLDARRPECVPIRRWVAAAAAFAHPSVRILTGSLARETREVAADGQTVQYFPTPALASLPTYGVPALSTLDFWRLANRRAYTRPGWQEPARTGRYLWPYRHWWQ